MVACSRIERQGGGNHAAGPTAHWTVRIRPLAAARRNGHA